MSVNDQYALNWSNHTNHIRKAFDSLLAANEFVDVTLSCEGKKICAHKMLLSACSTYFHDLFRDNPCQHPIVILKDVKFQNLVDILRFMYNGEVSVATENFDSFLKTAELLQVSGLTDDENRNSTAEKEDDSIENSEVPNENSERINLRPAIVKKSICELPKEKEIVRKRAVESSTVEEGTSQKKKKEDELKPDIEIKQEADLITLEEEHLEVKDPLELSQTESVEGLDSLQPETEMEETKVEMFKLLPVIPAKSKDKYEKEYRLYEEWRKAKNVYDVNEDDLLAYFLDIGKTCKVSSLWTKYSILKSTLKVFENVDISRFTKVTAYLKEQPQTCKSKKAKTLERKHIEKFLIEAPDNEYLMMKVALLMGVSGACRCDELTRLSIDDIQDKGSYLYISIPETKTNKPRNFSIIEEGYPINPLDIYKKYVGLRPSNLGHRRFFLNYKREKCTVQPVGINTLSRIPSVVATYLQLPEPESFTGHCFRRSSATF